METDGVGADIEVVLHEGKGINPLLYLGQVCLGLRRLRISYLSIL